MTCMKNIAGDVTVTAARREELPEIFALLEECDLPKEGLATHLPTILVARRGIEIAGCSALELYHESALLRSVAVKQPYRSHGIGRSLIGAALDLAMERGVSNVYLLTSTAEPFFLKLGFESISRDNVPENVRDSVEFTALCPDTATAMAMKLR